MPVWPVVRIADLAGYNLGVVYRELGSSDEAVKASQRMIDDYGKYPAPALREQVAQALVNKGVELGVLGRSDEAVNAYQQVIDVQQRLRPARACRPGAVQQGRPVGGARALRRGRQRQPAGDRRLRQRPRANPAQDCRPCT